VDGPSLVERLQARFAASGQIVETHAHRGDHTVVVDRQILPDVLRFCRDEPDLGFDMLTDLTAVDYSKFPGREDGPRFEVIYLLLSIPHNHRLRLKVRVSEDEGAVATATGVWPIANWLEREVWDMFGIRFVGHPDLRRLLLYEEFVGHPLRKDYPINRRQPLIGPKI
jgi:NADH-quinone oxidoreductase subunit C